MTGWHRPVARTARRLVCVLHRGSWTHFKRPWDNYVCAPGDSHHQALDGKCGAARARREEMYRASGRAGGIGRARPLPARTTDRPIGGGARVHG